MKNKIKQAQYEPYNLIAPSGNLIIESGVDFFAIDVSRGLNGNFDITGSLKINQFNVLSPDTSNTMSFDSFENGCRILAGYNNIVSGTDCCVVFGYNSNVYGNKNAVLFGDSINLGSQNTVAIGNNISINHDGAAVFADSRPFPKTSYGKDSLTIDYSGGLFVRNDSYFSKDVFCDEDLYVNGLVSGSSLDIDGSSYIGLDLNVGNSSIISGNLNVINNFTTNGISQLQSTFINGQRALTVVDLNSYSGFVTGTYLTRISFSNYTGSTQSTIDSLLTNKLSTSVFDSFTGSTLQTKVVMLTGGQTISGIKSFKQRPEICDGLIIPGQNNCDRYVPKSGSASGDWGHITYSGNYLYIATGTNKWGRVQISSW